MSDALEQGEVHLDVVSDKEIAYTVRQDEPPQTYIREDVVRAQIEAAVKRALEGAAKVCSTIIQDYDVMDSTGTKYLPLKTQKAAKSMVLLAREDIRALDPAQFLDGDK